MSENSHASRRAAGLRSLLGWWVEVLDAADWDTAGSICQNVRRLYLPDMEQEVAARMRAAGLSWAEVGHALGMSRQAAHERFSRQLA